MQEFDESDFFVPERQSYIVSIFWAYLIVFVVISPLLFLVFGFFQSDTSVASIFSSFLYSLVFSFLSLIFGVPAALIAVFLGFPFFRGCYFALGRREFGLKTHFARVMVACFGVILMVAFILTMGFYLLLGGEASLWGSLVFFSIPTCVVGGLSGFIYWRMTQSELEETYDNCE